MAEPENSNPGACYNIKGDRISLFIKAVPGSSKSAFGEIQEGRIKVKIAAAPEDGRANGELRAFLAKTLDVPKKDVVLAEGEKSRFKTVTLPLAAKESLEVCLKTHSEV
ncbi:MAG: DUF167 domain-containing protein [Treponema sp.]|jgi:uncharacterized protein (TIGR00251 family)|nr:DUF167 domain-containing protein [Treponema sp.]